MEAVAALSLACNVMQLISFGHETISLCRRLHAGASVDDGLTYNVQKLSDLSLGVRESLDQAETSRNLTKGQIELRAVAGDCLKAGTELKQEMGKFTSRRSSNPFSLVVRAVKTQVISKGKLESLMKTLDECQKTLDTHLLFQLWTADEISRLKQSVEWQKLRKEVQLSLQCHAKEMKKMSNVIKDESSTTRTHITAEASETRDRLTTRIEDLDRGMITEKQRDQILGSLRYDSMNARRNQITESQNGTSKWIFDKQAEHSWDDFMSWLTSDEKVYWISGKAASGKSTLMKYVVENVKTKSALQIWRPNVVIISAFIWRAGESMQFSLKGVLCSLLHQLISNQTVVAALLRTKSAVLQQKYTYHDWAVSELESLLSDILTQFSGPVCIFIDGLDEIRQHEEPNEVMPFIERIQNCPDIKMCVSSRPEPYFLSKFVRYPKLRLQDLTASDIRLVINRGLDELEVLLSSENTDLEVSRDRIRTLVTEEFESKANGVFLWVHLAFKSLRRGITNKDNWTVLEDRLKMLPSDLKKLYKDMWSRLNDDEELYRREAAIYFNLAIQALSQYSEYEPERQISLLEFSIMNDQRLQAACLELTAIPSSTEIFKKCKALKTRVETVCTGLLEFTPTTGIIVPSRSAEVEVKGKSLVIQRGHIKYVASDDNWKSVEKDTPEEDQLVRLTFIHRTAYDYLVEDEEGKALLSHDLTSQKQRQINILKADLCMTIWRGPYRSSLSSFMISLNRPESCFRKITTSEIFKLLELSEKFVTRGYIVPDLEWQHSRKKVRALPGGGDFLGLAALFGHVGFVRHRLVGIQVTIEYMTYILFKTIAGLRRRRHVLDDVRKNEMIAFIKWLLHSGADLNMHIFDCHIPLIWTNTLAYLLRCQQDDFREWDAVILETFLTHDIDLTSATWFCVLDWKAYNLVELGNFPPWGRKEIHELVVEINVAQQLYLSRHDWQFIYKDRPAFLEDLMKRITEQRQFRVLFARYEAGDQPSGDVGYQISGFVCPQSSGFRIVTQDDAQFISGAWQALQEAKERFRETNDHSEEKNELKQREAEVSRRIREAFHRGEEVDMVRSLKSRGLIAPDEVIRQTPPKMIA